jgi:uncharacterized protein YbbC (DUF1343 family)
MEACAEAGLPFMVLDRPNPNGHYVDGPVMDMNYSSFVGMHPIPVVHGMTVGEYAKMVNGEKWLKNGVQCKLDVVPCTGYAHQTFYAPPVKPSPNLPDIKSILLYPSTCFFEGTSLSIGRGTERPFQLFGAPEYAGIYSFSFVPKSLPGAKNPPLLGNTCYGKDLGNISTEKLRETKFNLGWLIEMYKAHPDKSKFFTDFFTRLAGGPELAQQIKAGLSVDEIRVTWEPGLAEFKKIRKKYLLYSE